MHFGQWQHSDDNGHLFELAQYGRILEMPQQVDFYRNKIKNASTRIFVIIPDALRYEVVA